MTVGNEEYGSWETDLHSAPNNPTTYAAAVDGSDGNGGYYALIKAASPTTLVGVVVEPNYSPWDQTVLTNAKGSYDFVEYHYYPETPLQENDTTLIKQAAHNLTANINKIKTELTNWHTEQAHFCGRDRRALQQSRQTKLVDHAGLVRRSGIGRNDERRRFAPDMVDQLRQLQWPGRQ